MNKKSYLLAIKLFLLVLSLTFITQVRSANIDNIRFPDSAWDGEVLNLLINGPKYLKKSLEFDLPPPPNNSSHKTTQELELRKRAIKQLQLRTCAITA
ncbi:MAG: hypothetical protein JKX76_07875 [Colwellia sp.]|nr:hypothetical protein [Colwellia sp.]